MYECEYCQRTFTAKSSLKHHQKTAKICLDKQGFEIEQFQCEQCNNFFTTKPSLDRHSKTCEYNLTLPYKETIETLQKENKMLKKQQKKYEKQIQELQDKLADIAKEGVKKTTNIVNNNNKIINISPLDLTTEKIKNILENKFERIHSLEGQKGAAQFAFHHLLKDEEGNPTYICTDPSRKIFKWKDNLGDIQKDVKAKKLTNKLVEGGLPEISEKISSEWQSENMGKSKILAKIQNGQTEIENLWKDNSVFVSELSSIATL